MSVKNKKSKMTLSEIKAELAEVARIGQAFIEGDLCHEVWQPYAKTFMKGDDMDYNPDASVPLKKTLLRLERIGRIPCNASLWRQRPDLPESGEALLYGSLSSPIGGDKPANRGYQPPKMTPEMEKVFLKGRSAWRLDYKCNAIRLQSQRGLFVECGEGLRANAALELFVPIKDSLGEIAAALEIHTIVLVG